MSAEQISVAVYRGWCKACDERIEAGDLVIYSEDEEGWVHEGCS